MPQREKVITESWVKQVLGTWRNSRKSFFSCQKETLKNRRNISFRWQRLMHDQAQILSHWPGLRNAGNTESKSSSSRTREVFSGLQTSETTTSTNHQASHYTLILLLKCSCLSCPMLFWHMQYLLAPHSSTLAWKIPWTEEPGGLQSMGSLGVGHNWATSLSLFTFMHWRRKW